MKVVPIDSESQPESITIDCKYLTIIN